MAETTSMAETTLQNMTELRDDIKKSMKDNKLNSNCLGGGQNCCKFHLIDIDFIYILTGQSIFPKLS